MNVPIDIVVYFGIIGFVAGFAIGLIARSYRPRRTVRFTYLTGTKPFQSPYVSGGWRPEYAERCRGYRR